MSADTLSLLPWWVKLTLIENNPIHIEAKRIVAVTYGPPSEDGMPSTLVAVSGLHQSYLVKEGPADVLAAIGRATA